MKQFQNSSNCGEPEKAEEINVPAKSVNTQKITGGDQIVKDQQNIVVAKRVNAQQTTTIAQPKKITGADLIVHFQQVGTGDILKGPQTANALKMKEVKDHYLNEYKDVKESTTTMVTWQEKKYMNMNAKIEGYRCIKLNPMTDPSVFEWSSVKPFRESDSSDTDESSDSYFTSASSLSAHSRSYTPDYPPGHPPANNQ